MNFSTMELFPRPSALPAGSSTPGSQPLLVTGCAVWSEDPGVGGGGGWSAGSLGVAALAPGSALGDGLRDEPEEWTESHGPRVTWLGAAVMSHPSLCSWLWRSGSHIPKGASVWETHASLGERSFNHIGFTETGSRGNTQLLSLKIPG